MNGATAEPWERTINPANAPIMTRIGSSQYFLRSRMYSSNSVIKDIVCSLELFRHAAWLGARRIALDPIAATRFAPSQGEQILPHGAHQKAHGRDHAVEHDGEHDRTDKAVQEVAEPQPKPLGKLEQRRHRERRNHHERCHDDRPPAQTTAETQRPKADDEKHGYESPAESAVAGTLDLLTTRKILVRCHHRLR